MATEYAIEWDKVGEHTYETGVRNGVLYVQDTDGTYGDAIAWNGLTAVTESPSGAESNPQYADDTKYLDLRSAEEFGATIEAFTYPDEFEACDGTASPVAGVSLGQQSRKSFGLCYRTSVGNDTDGSDYGFKLHIIYGATAAPSEKAYQTVNDSPEAITFSWEVTTVPVEVGVTKPDGTEYKKTATVVVDSTKCKTEAQKTALKDLMSTLYGTAAKDSTPAVPGKLPTPKEIIEALTVS